MSKSNRELLPVFSVLASAAFVMYFIRPCIDEYFQDLHIDSFLSERPELHTIYSSITDVDRIAVFREQMLLDYSPTLANLVTGATTGIASAGAYALAKRK